MLSSYVHVYLWLLSFHEDFSHTEFSLETDEDGYILRFQEGCELLESATCSSQYFQAINHNVKPPGYSPSDTFSETYCTKISLGDLFLHRSPD